MLSSDDAQRAFYEGQHSGGKYGAYESPVAHPFHAELKRLLGRHSRTQGKWLEVGCGRGFLQDVVADYVGVDLAEAVSASIRKPFVCASAEHLPFAGNRFDGLWSYAALEHVALPEQALSEMRRVLKQGGLLILAPAWQCRPWAGCDYAIKPFGELSFMDCVRKALVPLRNSVIVRAVVLVPRRVLRLIAYAVRRAPTPFHSCPLSPNYTEYLAVDADARHHMDPFDVILWFWSRGDRVLSHPTWGHALCVRNGALVVEVRCQ